MAPAASARPLGAAPAEPAPKAAVEPARTAGARSTDDPLRALISLTDEERESGELRDVIVGYTGTPGAQDPEQSGTAADGPKRESKALRNVIVDLTDTAGAQHPEQSGAADRQSEEITRPHKKKRRGKPRKNLTGDQRHDRAWMLLEQAETSSLSPC